MVISSGPKQVNCLSLLLCPIAAVCLFHVLSHSACVFDFQHSQPSEEQEPVLPEQTSLRHGKIFVKFLLEGSNATNYLRRASQPSRRFDRWLWPQQTWGPSLGWHIRLLLKGEVDGWGWGYKGCKPHSKIACYTEQESGRWGQVSYLDGITLYNPCKCTCSFRLMIGFITCFLLGLRAPAYSWAVNECGFLR